MTGALVTDTHPIIHWAGSRQKLSARTRRAFQACTKGKSLIDVPAAVIRQMAILEEHRKIRLLTPFTAWLDSLFESPGFVPVATELVHVKEAWGHAAVCRSL
jgi:PIN domain nuclease of toxin-antitoxin system